MDPGSLIVLVAVAGAGVAALASWWNSADQKARRALSAATRRRIADVTEGELVRVVGEVVVERPVRAPLSGRACAYWRVVVEEQRGGGSARHWAKIVDEHEGVDFLIRDERGKALVKTDGVRPVLENDVKFTSGFLADPTPELEAFLELRGIESRGWVFNKNIRYREGVAEPGEIVAAVGVGRWERDPDEEASAGPGYREARMPERLVLEAPDGGALLLSDEPEFTR